MATQRTSWKTLYTDLPEKIADILRSKRLKPDQITKKSDGELMAIEGINDAALESIRVLYPAEITNDDVQTPKDVQTRLIASLPAKKKHTHSSRYLAALKNVDKNRAYSIKDALATLAKISKGTKSNTLELHLNMIETGIRGEAKLPHSTGKQIAIEIFSEGTIAKLNAGELNFDLLLIRPSDMSKVARFAKLLGPKGLMPNPKNGTITDDPEKRAEELKKGATFAYKTEPKAPLMHLNLGKISQDLAQLEENITALFAAITTRKIKSGFVKTTHSPSIKLDNSIFQEN